MATTIKITLPMGEIMHDGKLVTFAAPCECTDITTLQIREYGKDVYTTYSFVDAMNEPVGSIIGAFAKDSVVTVILKDTRAVIQNASYAVARVKYIYIRNTDWSRTSSGTFQFEAPGSQTIENRDIVHIGLVQSDDPDTAELQREAFSQIKRVVVGDDIITFIAPNEAPNIGIHISMEVIRR